MERPDIERMVRRAHGDMTQGPTGPEYDIDVPVLAAYIASLEQALAAAEVENGRLRAAIEDAVMCLPKRYTKLRQRLEIALQPATKDAQCLPQS